MDLPVPLPPTIPTRSFGTDAYAAPVAGLLGGMTVLSAALFLGLKSEDGAEVSRHKAIVPAE